MAFAEACMMYRVDLAAAAAIGKGRLTKAPECKKRSVHKKPTLSFRCMSCFGGFAVEKRDHREALSEEEAL
jgi:hypothetical protein